MARQNRIKMVINGDGLQIRDFIHVNDVCTAIYKCVMHDEKIPEPIDIGSGQGVSVLNLAEMFGTEYSFCIDSDTVGSSVSVANTTQAKEILDFEAVESLSEYIKNVRI
jgi:nucleoside-diphosphate-sugar epimerase